PEKASGHQPKIKLWYQQTRHTIELTNNTPQRGSPTRGPPRSVQFTLLAIGPFRSLPKQLEQLIPGLFGVST
ncbi:hypothetical protein, partial [Kocuria rhizophila]|uniref:hypothetical protein n=1 Tax=Kocuria rhizophila TaxID=72000 RepID=UPI001E2FDB0E